MALPPIHTRFAGITSENVNTAGVGQTSATNAAGLGRLFVGQVLDVSVIKVAANEVWLQNANQVLRATMPPISATVGERLLLKVIDPNASPPRLKLLTDDELPASLLAGLGLNIRSLLLRHNSLGPTQLLLQRMFNQPPDGAPAAGGLQGSLLSSLFAVGKKSTPVIDAKGVKEWLEKSGLFTEAAQNKDSAAKPIHDLKTLLISLVGQDNGIDPQTLQMGIEGVVSTQIKALDAQLTGNLLYTFLLPFFGQSYIQTEIRRNASEIDRDQWRVHLRHQSQEMGHYAVDILLHRKSVTIIFKSDQAWVVDSINLNQARLIEAVEAAGLNAQKIAAVKLPVQAGSPYDSQTPDGSILDMRI